MMRAVYGVGVIMGKAKKKQLVLVRKMRDSTRRRVPTRGRA